MTDREWLKVPEVAYELGVTVVRVQRWLKAGTLRGKKIGGLWFVHRSELEVGYDAERARPQRGDAVPETPGPSLGGDGDDAGRTPPFRVSRVQERGGSAADRTQTAAGRGGGSGPPKAARWTVPPEVAS